jgi:hypothetical protein
MQTESFKESRGVREVTQTLTYADTTSAKAFTLPAGSRVIAWVLNVQTAFSGGTAELDIGLSSDGDYLVDAGSLASVGQIVPSTTVVHPGYETTVPTDIYMNVGASNTVGSVEVTCLFSLTKSRRL